MLQIREMILGSGMPKICVPLTSTTLVGLREECEAARKSKADFVEWRVDYFDKSSDVGIPQALDGVREALGNMPLLFTYRTQAEGGSREITRAEYCQVNRDAITSGHLDLIDIELSAGDDVCRELITLARKHNVTTVISSHDFTSTPPQEELRARMRKALELGGDIPKLAVMPQSAADVITLLSAADQFSREFPDHLSVTMSMGKMGGVSRISGEFFASCFSFASLWTPTAPGQLSVADLHTILHILHVS